MLLNVLETKAYGGGGGGETAPAAFLEVEETKRARQKRARKRRLRQNTNVGKSNPGDVLSADAMGRVLKIVERVEEKVPCLLTIPVESSVSGCSFNEELVPVRCISHCQHDRLIHAPSFTHQISRELE